jgi:hypothetical protein
MTPGRIGHPHDAALIAACALLAVVLVIESSIDWDSARRLPETDPAAIPAPAADAATESPRPPSRDGYRSIVERPLFTADRRPPPPSAETPVLAGRSATGARDAAGGIQLLGVVIEQDNRWALLKAGAQPAVLVAEGEQVNGWQLARVHPDAVLLKTGAEEQRLQITRKAAPRPPARAQPKREAALRERRAAEAQAEKAEAAAAAVQEQSAVSAGKRAQRQR